MSRRKAGDGEDGEYGCFQLAFVVFLYFEVLIVSWRFTEIPKGW